MSVYCILHQTLRLSDPTRKVQHREPLAYNNALAHSFRVTVINDDGTDADLTGVGCVGSFMKSNNETVTPINGTVSGNTAEIVLPASCYVTPGRFKFTMNLGQATSPEGIDDFSTGTSYSKGDLVVYNNVVYRFTENHAAGAWTGTDAVPDGSSRTVLWVEGMVERNTTETIVDPGTPVGNITQAINNANAAAAAATGAASAANTAATAAQGAAAQAVGNIANAYSTSSTYAVGDYVINSNDGKLYRCNTAITTAEAWTAAHWDWVALANDVVYVKDDVSDLKSAIGDLEVPALPSADGTYSLRLTVSGGAAAYAWAAE